MDNHPSLDEIVPLTPAERREAILSTVNALCGSDDHPAWRARDSAEHGRATRRPDCIEPF